PPHAAGETPAAAPHRAAAARRRHQRAQRSWLVPVRTVGPYGHLLRNIRPRGAQKTIAPSAESTDLGRHAGEHAGTGPFLLAFRGRTRQRFDLLPSGLYRRPRHLTGSASPSGDARGLDITAVRDALPPVGNLTLPRRSMRFGKAASTPATEPRLQRPQASHCV